MKKATVISFILFFAFIFLISLYHYSLNYKSAVRSIPSQYSYSIEVNAPEPEIVYAMMTVAQDDKISVVRQINYRDENQKSVTKDYIYAIEKYEKALDIVSGRMLAQTDMGSKYFLSTETTGSDEQIGIVYHFGNSIAYYMYPLSALPTQYDTRGVYNISVVDEEGAKCFLEHLLEHLDEVYGLTLDSSEFILRNSITNNYNTSISKEVLSIVNIALYCILALIVIFSCIFFTKEISVLKMNGYSNLRIVNKTIMSSLMSATLCSLAVSIIMMLLLDRGKYKLLLGVLPKMVYAGVISLFLAFAIYYCYVCITKEALGVKGKSPIKIVSIANLAFYVTLSVICIGVIGTVGDNLIKVEKKTESLSVWQRVQNYGVFFPASSGFEQSAIRNGEYPLDVPSYEFFKYVNLSENGIYAAALPFTEENSQYNTDILSRIFTINANYLELFPIVTADGNRVTVEQSEEKTIFLVPEKYRDQENELTTVLKIDRTNFHDDLHVGLYCYDERPQSKEIEIIFVADQQEYFSINPDVGINNNNMITDAIVLVLTDGNCLVPDINLFGSNPSLYIPLGDRSTSDKQMELLDELKELSLEDNFPYFVQSNTLVLQQIDELRSQTYALFAVLSIVIAMMLLNIIQAIVTLFRLNEYRCFTLMSLGRPKVETLRNILIPIAFAQVAIVGLSLILNGGKNWISLIIVQILEICFAIAIVLLSERKNILNVLKKGV